MKKLKLENGDQIDKSIPNGTQHENGECSKISDDKSSSNLLQLDHSKVAPLTLFHMRPRKGVDL